MLSWMMADEAAWHAMSLEGNSSYRFGGNRKNIGDHVGLPAIPTCLCVDGKTKMGWGNRGGILSEWVKNQDETRARSPCAGGEQKSDGAKGSSEENV